MRHLERLLRTALVLCVFAMASYLGLHFGTGGLWRGLGAAHAVSPRADREPAFDLSRIEAVNETLKHVMKKYVDPGRIQPRQMFVSALDAVQQEVAQVIVLHDERSPTVKVRVDAEEREFRVDNVQGPWDVAARLREVFAFLQQSLADRDVNLREVEYAACNGILRTLDPHSVFLSPEAYGEMTLSTSGKFGGLGIVISIRDQMLTIMRPMPGTPAHRATLRRMDRIAKINNESTLNMPLDDAVGRLRGDPGSRVTIWIQRDGPGGWEGARPFELVREEIKVESVDSRSLAPGIGYVRLKQFQATTDDELAAALDELGKKQPLRGLVLDLRDNPGGLLDQAAKVADRFLERGVIVATVGGAAEPRDEKVAQRRDTQPNYPIAVLVNAQSASASEIVAGALKNLDRAVVVGETTFGKGSVQLVFPRIAGDAALKLTIAQYLTPGDVSIQGVGVTPDVELDRMTVDPLEMDLFRSERRPRERDLRRSLSSGLTTVVQAAAVVRYNLPVAERLAVLDRGADTDDEFRLDFPTRFARDLVSELSPGRRQEQVLAAKGFGERAEAAELAAVAEDLRRMGVDWSAPPAGASTGVRAPELEVTAATDRPSDTVVAGEPMELRVTVTNRGKEPLFRLRGITRSDAGYYDEKELVFGRVDPGKTVTARAPLGFCELEGRRGAAAAKAAAKETRRCHLPMNAVTRQDVVKVRFFAEGGEAPGDVEIRPTVRSLPAPIFAYSYHVVDDRPGNGDGQISRGEGATIYLTVKNVGSGRSYETQANLRNLTGDGLLLRAGRFDVSNMNPGDVREVAFTFDVLPGLREDSAKVELSVGDRDLGVVAIEKVTLPVTSAGLAVEAAKESAVAAARAPVRGQPLAAARVVGDLPAGTVVEVIGRHGEFSKVALGGSRFGFVASRELTAAPGRAGRPALEPLLSRSPPLLDVAPARLATTDAHVRIEATAQDTDQVIDAYVFVGPRKVHYQSNRKSDRKDRLALSLDVALEPGVNVINVIARESSDTATRRTLVVRRDGPGGEALPTPKSDLLGADWEFSDGE
ncbi:MAG: PDZ domain-containing protein [Deltaproteobacteria bacterium]|nr:PDZ domain-containing protein [Deltaproteobacteria bacterium]